MAEYIDKKYLDRKFQIDMMCLWGGTMIDSKEIIDSLPTADVVERSKIDKAIEEITNLVGYEDGIDTMNVGDDLMISWCKTLEILRNIGE